MVNEEKRGQKSLGTVTTMTNENRQCKSIQAEIRPHAVAYLGAESAFVSVVGPFPLLMDLSKVVPCFAALSRPPLEAEKFQECTNRIVQQRARTKYYDIKRICDEEAMHFLV